MWPYSWTHVGTPSHLGHMDWVAATMPSHAHAGAAQEAPNIGQSEGQDVPLVGLSHCIVKGGIPSSRRYLPTLRLPPRAPSCRPHSAQSQLARARAVGLVTCPHARNPPHPQPVGSGPRQPAQRAGSRGWESARPRTPHTQAGGAPPGHPHAAPTARKSARCGVGDGSPRPRPPAATASG